MKRIPNDALPTTHSQRRIPSGAFPAINSQRRIPDASPLFHPRPHPPRPIILVLLRLPQHKQQELEHAMPNVSATLPLLHGKITLVEALDEEDNVLFPLAYSRQREDFLFWIYEHREDFKALVSLHLGLANSETCRLGEFKEWKHGSFNVCIPIYIDNWRKHPGKRRVMLRLPLPYKVGESPCPGNADEKLRAEAAAFIWIRDNCPGIPIPFLWGFGFPCGQSV